MSPWQTLETEVDSPGFGIWSRQEIDYLANGRHQNEKRKRKDIHRPLSKKDEQAILHDYAKYATIATIAQTHVRSERDVRAILHKHGVVRRPGGKGSKVA